MATENVEHVPFTFHEALARHRIAAGLSQQQVADALKAKGIPATSASVGNWERDTVPRSAETVRVLEEIFDAAPEFTESLGLAPRGDAPRLAEIESRLAKIEQDLRELLHELRSGR